MFNVLTLYTPSPFCVRCCENQVSVDCWLIKTVSGMVQAGFNRCKRVAAYCRDSKKPCQSFSEWIVGDGIDESFWLNDGDETAAQTLT